LNGLTGLRFVAAISVVIAHFTGAGYSPFGIHYTFSTVGMPLFFTLSGFVIHYVYAAPFARSWSQTGVEFAVARFSRLYPLFALLLLTSLLFSPLGKALGDRPWTLLSYATMTGSWWYWNVDGVTLAELPFGLSWSVSTEVFFYVVYALILYRLSGLRSLPGAIAALVVFCVLAYVAVYFAIETMPAWDRLAREMVSDYVPFEKSYPNSFTRWFLYVSPYFHLLEFIAGVLTCQVFLVMRRAGITIGRGWREVMAWLGVALLAAGATVLTALPWLLQNAPPGLRWYVVMANWLAHNFLLAPVCCAVILAVAAGRSSVERALAVPVVVLFGEASYSIYLAHPLLASVAYVTKDNAFPLVSYVVAFFFLLIFSLALYRTVELPAKRFLRQWLSRGGTIAPPMPFIRHETPRLPIR
jgi:peptidoglycan/LPS O-acetylase OafA/YrhL